MYDNYEEARAEAQNRANATGLDHGVEQNKLFKHWSIFTLPQKRFRSGHELRCEVVMCERLENCNPGHGPCAENS